MAQTVQSNGCHKAEAFITLATNDVYSRGALVLAESLKKHGTTRKLVIMITPHVSPSARVALQEVFDDVRLVDVLDSKDAAHLALLKRPELGITFTKIHCWAFTEFTKCVFMDADMMALQNIDDLFDREELSASPDSGWPDVFNSGLFVFRPSMETFNGLLLLAKNEGSFDGGDQGLLNTYFSDWATKDISRHLPFLYNLHVSASYTYLPAFKKFGKDTKVVHFLGQVKPWHHVYNRVTGGVQQIAGPLQAGTRHFPEYLSEWWKIYNDKVQKFFSKEQEMFTKGSSEPNFDIHKEETPENNKAYVTKIPSVVDETDLFETRSVSLPTEVETPPGVDLSQPLIPEEKDLAEEKSLANIMLIPSAILQSHDETQQAGASSGPRDPEDVRRTMLDHQREWERGNIDYMDKDSWPNIQAMLDLFL